MISSMIAVSLGLNARRFSAGCSTQVYTYDYHGPVLDEVLRDSIARQVSWKCENGYDVDRAFQSVFRDYGLDYEVRLGHGFVP